ncbi:MAG: response regulator transcription factor [Nitrospirae bacterium]|nr:response regulator transcription factor [Nitrospirota bacterium]
MRILIVEDEKVSSQKMQFIMNNFGECCAVARGADAIETFSDACKNKVPYDIITLDINLDDMSGLSVLQSIKATEEQMKIPQTKRAKIIMVTSREDEVAMATSKSAQCDAYIVKPFTLSTMAACLEKIWADYTKMLSYYDVTNR